MGYDKITIMRTIDGKTLASKIRAEVKDEIQRLGITPGLAVILVGDNPASHLYVSLKEKAAREVGIKFEKYVFAGTKTHYVVIPRQEAEEPGVAVPLVAGVIQVQVAIVGIAVEVGHVAVAVHQDQPPLYKMPSAPPPLECSWG